MTLQDSEKRRYAKHLLLLPEIGEAGQEKLLAAKMLVIGTGGLGSPILYYLAAAGVGTLGVIDDDRVELSNLQRQILFETGDIGRPKADAAADRLSEINPDITIHAYAEKLEAANAKAHVASYDLVIDGSDNFTTRFLVNDTCFKLGKTLVSAAVDGFAGQLSIFKAHLGEPHPCYRCFCPEAPPLEAKACQERGVLGALCGVMGSLAATETIKEILGIGESLSGRLLRYDALLTRFRESRIVRDANCKLCAHPQSG